MEEAQVSGSAKLNNRQRHTWVTEALHRDCTTPRQTSTMQVSTLSTSESVAEVGAKPLQPTTPVTVPNPIPTTISPSFLQGGQKREFKPQNPDTLLQTYNKNVEENKRLQVESFPFISPHFHEDFRLMKGLVVVGALTGQSKSTTNANVLSGFLESCPGKRAIAITNEEPLEGVYNRIACLKLGVNYGRYQTGLLKSKTMEQVEEIARTLMGRIEVVCQGDWSMTHLEDVKSVLDYASVAPDIGLVTLDYFQTVVSSRLNRAETPYQVFKKLGLYFKEYGARPAPPIVCFVQIRAERDKSLFKDRIEGDRELLNHAFAALEVVPNFKDFTTKFIVRKSRYGLPPEGTEILAEFKDGALIFRPEGEQF